MGWVERDRDKDKDRDRDRETRQTEREIDRPAAELVHKHWQLGHVHPTGKLPRPLHLAI